MKILHKLKSMKSAVRNSSLVFSMVFAIAFCFSAISVQAQTSSEIPGDVMEKFHGLIVNIATDMDYENSNIHSDVLQQDNEAIKNYFEIAFQSIKIGGAEVNDVFNLLSVEVLNYSSTSQLAGNLFDSDLRGNVNPNPEFSAKLNTISLESVDGVAVIKELYLYLLDNR